MNKYNTVIFILILAVVGIIGYMFFTNQISSIPIEEIRFEPKEISIYVGEKNKVIPTIIPDNASSSDIIWKSNNEGVATVDKDGTISAIGEGQTDITASSGDISDFCHVVVMVREVEKIEVNETTITLVKGGQKEINAIIYPYNASYPSLIYQSSDTNIVSVDNNGVVYGVDDGAAELIIKDSRERVETRIKVVVGILLESITIDKQELNLYIGKEDNLKAIYKPENTTLKNISWSSSNNNIAEIDQNGKVTGIGEGETVITLTSTDTGKTATCKVKVVREPKLVQSISLDKTSIKLDPGKTDTLKVTINPSNADDKVVTWKSSDDSIATVDQNGIVTAKKSGSVTITVTSSNGITATCTVIVKSNPIVPDRYSNHYESTTLKYYVQNKNTYYLTYIWMEDPYTQIKKLDATTAKYGKVMSDAELSQENKKLVRMSVGEMMNAYITYGMIPKDKAAIAYNASGFYVSGTWNPPTDYYNYRSDCWLVITDGKVIRNRTGEANLFWPTVIGISSSGTLRLYAQTYGVNNGQQVYDAVTADNVKNTWSFYPTLIKDGNVSVSDKASAKRQAICQIDSNNYVMYTSIGSAGLADVAQTFHDIGCKTAFNLDGGGSTSLFIKKPGRTYVDKIKCSDGSTHDKCRSIVEGIYFTEK